MTDLLNLNDRPGQYPPSFYAADADHLAPFPAAEGDITCDVCIVGGGFTGLSTAKHLAERGYDVRLVEAQRVGFGASGRNGGQVNRGQRLDQDVIEKMCGVEHAKALWSIGVQAVDLIRELAKSDLLHAEFHPGSLHADHKPAYAEHSKAYADKLNTEYDYPHIKYLDRDAVQDMVATNAYCGGTFDSRAGHIQPLELALGLCRMAVQAGAQIHETSRVVKVDKGDPALVETDQARIRAKFVVLACNGYIGDLDGDVARHVMPINNFIAATRPMAPEEQEKIIKGNIAVADSKFVVNYFRFSDDHRLLFGGTETYRYKFPSRIGENVRKPMSLIFPQLKDIDIDYAWGGTLGITMNRLPYYQRFGGNILSLSGFSGHGVAMATLSGQIAAETIAGQAERFDIMAKIPSPRFPGGPRMRHPLLILAMVWYSLRDRL